jgi:hypothetical protein
LATNAGLLTKQLERRANMHVISRAIHFSFLANFDRAAFHNKFNAEVATFLERQLSRQE